MKKIISLLLAVVVIVGCTSSAFAEPTWSVFADKFKDVPASQYGWALDPIGWAVSKNITNGTSDTTFSPAKPCTRAEVVTFLWRMAGQPAPKTIKNPFRDVKNSDYFYSAVLWASSWESNNITKGTSANTFSPYATCTRAQIVTFLWRFYQIVPDHVVVIDKKDFYDVPIDQYYSAAVRWAVENHITTGAGTKKLKSGLEVPVFLPNNPCTRAETVTFIFRAANMFGEKPIYVNW